jgi:hypothetical protein
MGVRMTPELPRNQVPLASQRSLASVQLGRKSVAEIFESRTPLREAALESFRRRNATLDGIFYDIGTVTKQEATAIAPWLAREGEILIVPPTGQGPLVHCATPDGFATAGGKQLRVLAVAGVGSSALGAAAFARNIADALGVPVAAVVSGYGLADLLTEALGGWFWFGALNRFRHQFEGLDAVSRTLNGMEAVSSTATGLELGDISRDTATVMALLADSRFSFSLLTGHSKGNLVISEACTDSGASRPERRFPTTNSGL